EQVARVAAVGGEELVVLGQQRQRVAEQQPPLQRLEEWSTSAGGGDARHGWGAVAGAAERHGDLLSPPALEKRVRNYPRLMMKGTTDSYLLDFCKVRVTPVEL